MKAQTWITKILNNQKCSINNIEGLTNSLKKEGLLDKDLYIRFKFLSNEFDIVNFNVYDDVDVSTFTFAKEIELENLLDELKSINAEYQDFLDEKDINEHEEKATTDIWI